MSKGYKKPPMALRKEDQKTIPLDLSEIVDSCPNPVICFGYDLSLKYMNAAAEPVVNGGNWLLNGRIEPDRRSVLDQVISSGVIGHEEVQWNSRVYRFTYFPRMEEQLVFVYGADLTLEKQAEMLAKENERRLLTLMSNLPGMVYRCLNDRKWTMEYVSEGSTDLTGYSPSDLIGSRKIAYGDLIHPDDRQDVWDTIQRSVNDMEPFEVTYRIETKEGDLRQVRELGRPVFSEEGDLEALEGFSTDITDQTRARKELARKEEWFRSLVQNAPDSIVVIDGDGNITYVSPSVERILHYPPEEMRGTSPINYFHPDDIPAVRRSFSDAISKGGTLRVSDLRVRRADGEYLYVEFFVTNLLNHPAVRGLIINGRDITDRVRAETAIRESEEKFRGVAERSSDVIILSDSEGNTFYISPSVSRILGYEPDEFIQKRPEEVIFADDLPVMRSVMKSALHGETTVGGELRILKQDGTFACMELSATPVFTADEITGIQVLGHDISERKQAEDALRESELRLSELVDHMSSGVVVYEAVDGGNDFIIRKFNLAAEKHENLRKEDIIGRRLTEVFPGVREFGIIDALQRVWNTGKPERLPMKLYTDFRISGWRDNYLYKLPSGEVVAVYDDVTEQKHAEMRIEHLNQVLYAIRDIDRLMVYENDPDRLISRVCTSLVEKRGFAYVWIMLTDESGNPVNAAEAGVSSSFDDFKGHLFEGEISPCGRMALPSPEIQIIERGSTLCGKCPLRSISEDKDVMAQRLEHDGKIFGVMVATLPPDVTIDEEERGLFNEITRDVAFALRGIEIELQRNEAEKALKGSEERFRSVVQNSTDVISILDSSGSIVYLSPSVKQLLGYTPDELLGKTIFSIINADDIEQVSAVLESFVVNKVDYVRFELRALRKDAVPVEVEVRANNLLDNPSIRGIVVNTRDISDRKELERLKKEAFVTIDKNYEQLAILNDNIRNPLTVIAGLAGMMEDETGATILGQAEEINTILKELDRGWLESKKVRDFLRKHYPL